MGSFWMKFSILLAVVFMLETANAASNLKWIKASNGQVPEYAVAGGENYPGEVLYVARVGISSGLTPGKMNPSSRLAHTSWGGKEHYRSSYEILTNPGWRSHLEWKKSSGKTPPANAVVGGSDKGKPLYVSRFLYSDGHMIPGKAAYFYGYAYVGYGGKEYYKREWWVLVEHTSSGRKREMSSRFEYPELPDVEPLKRAPILDDQ
ncbi:natterin-4-like [Actinia tenebrosa]|uniref:Natterin-4-like n=1 Tax=Actinia tenebrosa TaxID=6105 RepID=A0A6P8IY19_ACTTE|nr:natterin-4-like [Actinia tenebrosa]